MSSQWNQSYFLDTRKPRADLPYFSSLKLLQYSTKPEAKCWKCDLPRQSDNLFCSNCKALQEPLKQSNYFDIIGVEMNYDISIEEVQRKHRELQKVLHPDKFGNKSEKEKELSDALSSLVNKASATLLNPLDRGLYMLKLHNMTIPEESATSNLAQEFLMEVMELNERIEESAQDRRKIIDLMEENGKTLRNLAREISKAFAMKDLEQAKQLLITMKYYTSIEARLKTIKENLGIVR